MNIVVLYALPKGTTAGFTDCASIMKILSESFTRIQGDQELFMAEKSFLNLTCIIQSVETPQVHILENTVNVKCQSYIFQKALTKVLSVS